MSGAAVCVLLPWAGAVLAALLARRPAAARWVHVAACAVTLAAALALWGERPGPGWLDDPVALGAAALAAAAALAGAVAALPVRAPPAAGEDAGDAPAGGGAGRFVPAVALALLGSVLLGLLADSAAGGWLGLAASVAIASAAPLLRGPDGEHAARALALPAAGALAVALLGTILLSAGGGGRWGVPPGAASDPAILALGCVLLLAGCGLAAGLAPLHGWLGAAQEAAPRELGVLLCAPLPGLALVLLLRVARVAAASGAAGLLPAALLGAGLLSVALAGLSLWRGRAGGTVRLATLLHGGLAAAAFGLGGGGAVFAGLLHLAVSGLARVAAVLAGVDSEAVADGNPVAPGGRGWLAPLVVLALAGVPPLALFAGEFLVLTEMLARRPALAAVLLAGLAAGALGLLRRGLHGPAAGRMAQGAAWAALAAAMLLGLAMPSAVSDGLTRAAEAFAGG
ncbi:MAG: proton-conducting transporter membrane subunit [Janthinobacterium lividum]